MFSLMQYICTLSTYFEEISNRFYLWMDYKFVNIVIINMYHVSAAEYTALD